MYIIIKNTVLITVLTTFLVNGIITLLEKFNALEWLMLRSNKFFYKMLDCYFCLSHHLTALLILPILITDFKLIYLAIPLMVAGIINQIK